MWGRRRRATAAQADEIQIPETLFTARVMQGYTRAEVADKTGWTVEQVLAFERCETDPTLAQIRRYSHAIGVRTSWGVEMRQT